MSVGRIGQDLFGGAELHEPPVHHHRCAFADISDDLEIVRDHDQTQSLLLAKEREDVENLGLNRNIERRNRLVEDQQLGLWSESPCNRNPLPLTSGEGGWEFFCSVGLQTDEFEDFDDSLMAFGRTAEIVRHKRLVDEGANLQTWVERRGRVLKDRLKSSAKRANLRLGR